MSSLYPTLEDMKVHQIQQAQADAFAAQKSQHQYPNESTINPSLSAIDPETGQTDLALVYPCLMSEYMGLKLEPPTPPLVAPTHSENTAAISTISQSQIYPSSSVAQTGRTIIAPLTYNDPGMKRANLTNGIREVQCCKDENGKFGLRLKDVNQGLFVQFVQKGSPAALTGLRFGDQILQINSMNVAGYTSDQAFKLLNNIKTPQVYFVVRDRPFERTITLHKNSLGNVGFTHDDGLIKSIVQDSSAARNGLLVDHYVLEVDGQNVVGLKSKQLAEIISYAGRIVTLTIIPKNIYEHIVKCMADSMLKKFMDRSIPEIY